jgi:cell division protein FtsW (lipid II flippase)
MQELLNNSIHRCCCTKKSFGDSFLLLLVGVGLFLIVAKWLLIIVLIGGLIFYTKETISWLAISALLAGLTFLRENATWILHGIGWLLLIVVVLGIINHFRKKEVQAITFVNPCLALKNITRLKAWLNLTNNSKEK